MKKSLTKRCSEADCLSRVLLSQASRQATGSLIADVRQKKTMSAIEHVIVGFGALFFIGHILLTAFRYRSAGDRNQRLEALGTLVPGSAGVLIAFAVLSPLKFLRPVSAVIAMALIVFGRALYELAFFQKRTRKTRNQK